MRCVIDWAYDRSFSHSDRPVGLVQGTAPWRRLLPFYVLKILPPEAKILTKIFRGAGPARKNQIMQDQSPNSWEARADAHSFYGFTDLPSIHDRGTVVLTHGKGPYVMTSMDANTLMAIPVFGTWSPALTIPA